MWPKQSECNVFYGNPRGRDGQCSSAWVTANLVSVQPPWKMHMGDIPIRRFRMHKKCAASLDRVLAAAWAAIEMEQREADVRGWSAFSGSFNYRLKRGGQTLSMHSYGAAIDFDALNNGFGDTTPKLKRTDPLVQAFLAEGWIWGGSWQKPDAMHFQAAIV
jgi:hypothetical protein